MKTKGKGKAITGIAMAAIMLASVFAAMVPMGTAVSTGTNFNSVNASKTSETVLVGQNVEFTGPWADASDVRVQKYDDGEWYFYDGPWDDGKAYNVNWDPALTLRATDGSGGNTSLAVKDPNIPLKLKVGTKEVSTLTVGTDLKIDTGGINLFDQDKVDLVIIGPLGKVTNKNNQGFTNITVRGSDSLSNFGTSGSYINTTDWKIGDYTFQIKTKSAYACGLSASSAVKDLAITKGKIDIKADTTSITELKLVELTVTGIANRNITVRADPTKNEHVIFPAGINDNPKTETLTGAIAGGVYNTLYCYFNHTIDADGTRTYSVKFNETGSYTIKVIDWGLDGTLDKDDFYDTVDITVTEKGVTFDLPVTLVIGEKFTMAGTADTGTDVDIFVDGVLHRKLDDLVLVGGEFSEEMTADGDIGMSVPGSVRLKAWIDCDKNPGQNPPTTPTDGDTAVLLVEPGLTAEISVETVAQEDSFYVTGTSKGARSVDVLTVSPKGASGKGLSPGDVSGVDGILNGLTLDPPSVSEIDDSFSQKLTVDDDANTGSYLVAVLYKGRDGHYGAIHADGVSLTDALEADYGSLVGKTREQILTMLVDLTTGAGSDDLIWLGKIKVEGAKVTLDTIADVAIGEPLAVAGTTNREEGHILLITAKGPVELTPKTVAVENGTFSATFDTSEAVVGTYTVTADDGDGHTDDATVEILTEVPVVPTATPAPTAKPTATPAPTPVATAEPTPTPTEEPGFEAVFAIAGLLSIAYLVLRRRK